jgi:O-antigen ligase
MYNLSYRLILIFCLALPLQIALNPAPGIDLASARVFSLVLFLIWLIEGLVQKKVSLPVGSQPLFILSFLFFASFSLFFSSNIEWGFRKIAFLLSFFPIYLIASTTCITFARKINLIKNLVIGSVIVAVIGIIQFSLQYFVGIGTAYSWWGQNIAPIFLGKAFSQSVLENSSWLVNAGGMDFFRLISVFPDPHMFSFYLTMTFPFAFIFVLNTETRKKRLFWIISSLVILLADLLTFSRGGYLGMAVCLFVLLGPIIFLISPVKKMAFFFFSVCFFSVLAFWPNPITQRLSSSFDFSEGSNNGRIETWRQAIEVVQKNPLGVGIGNYPLTIKPSADYREPIYAHSIYLDIAVEMGILCLIIWALLIISTLISFWNTRKKSAIFLAGCASVAAFSTHALVENPLFSVHVLPLFLMIIAIANYETKEKNHA